MNLSLSLNIIIQSTPRAELGCYRARIRKEEGNWKQIRGKKERRNGEEIRGRREEDDEEDAQGGEEEKRWFWGERRLGFYRKKKKTLRKCHIA